MKPHLGTPPHTFHGYATHCLLASFPAASSSLAASSSSRQWNKQVHRRFRQSDNASTQYRSALQKWQVSSSAVWLFTLTSAPVEAGLVLPWDEESWTSPGVVCPGVTPDCVLCLHLCVYTVGRQQLAEVSHVQSSSCITKAVFWSYTVEGRMVLGLLFTPFFFFLFFLLTGSVFKEAAESANFGQFDVFYFFELNWEIRLSCLHESWVEWLHWLGLIPWYHQIISLPTTLGRAAVFNIVVCQQLIKLVSFEWENMSIKRAQSNYLHVRCAMVVSSHGRHAPGVHKGTMGSNPTCTFTWTLIALKTKSNHLP